MRRVVGCLCAAAALLFPVATPAAFAARATEPSAPPPRAWILVDADSGAVLSGQQEHLALPPASTVKVMTAITAAELLKSDARISVSANAAAREPMKIDMREGEVWPYDHTMQSMLMVSANDAAYALAENAGGSLDGFATRMNDLAKRLGMRDSTFNDPAGLDDQASFRGGSRVSAYDLAIAARNLLSVPQLATIVGTRKATFVDPRNSQRSLTNHNALLRLYDGANGMKTGYTKQSGRTLIASASRNGRTMIAVVLDVSDHYGWASQLLDQGFATAANAKGTGERLPTPAVVPGRLAATAAPETTKAATPSNAEGHLTTSGFTLPLWAEITLGAITVLAIAYIVLRLRVRARRRARLARQRQIEAARVRSLRAPIDRDVLRRSGSAR